MYFPFQLETVVTPMKRRTTNYIQRITEVVVIVDKIGLPSNPILYLLAKCISKYIFYWRVKYNNLILFDESNMTRFFILNA